MIMRNDAACLSPAERTIVVPDGHQRVFNHHVYEYRKGLRDLALQTLPRRYGPVVIARLEDLDIAYLIYPAGRRNVNVFFGAPECLEIVRRIGKFDLSRYTPEEDFILGIMLGYGRRQQCTRYLDLLGQGVLQPAPQATDRINHQSQERNYHVYKT